MFCQIAAFKIKNKPFVPNKENCHFLINMLDHNTVFVQGSKGIRQRPKNVCKSNEVTQNYSFCRL